jgi:lipoate-protein ligase A
MSATASWLLLPSGPAAAPVNLALDEALLEAMPRLGRPVLRFYSWMEPAASFGYFQKYAAVERMTLLRPLVRRPTAGGLVPHEADWTYSLAFPANHPWHHLKALQSYQRVHEWLRSAFTKLSVETELAPAPRKAAPGQCFVGHEQFDLLWQGRKIAGAAQRRTRLGLLIQGSVQPPPIPITRADWEAAMCAVAPLDCGDHWTEYAPDAELTLRADELVRHKYAQPSYNQKR